MKWENSLKILISYCQNLKALKDSHGDTLLHKAVSLGNTQFARILMNAGIDLATENRSQATPMDQAVRNGNFAVIEEMIMMVLNTANCLIMQLKQDKRES